VRGISRSLIDLLLIMFDFLQQRLPVDARRILQKDPSLRSAKDIDYVRSFSNPLDTHMYIINYICF